VTARVDYDARPYGFSGPATRVTRVTPAGLSETFTAPPVISRETVFPARSGFAWEITKP